MVKAGTTPLVPFWQATPLAAVRDARPIRCAAKDRRTWLFRLRPISRWQYHAVQVRLAPSLSVLQA